MNIAEKLENIESSLITGDLIKANKALVNLYKKQKIPFNRLANFGNLANRCSEFQLTINALHESAIKDQAHCEILKEYSVALLFLGCRKLARSNLDYLKEQNHSDADFLLGLYFMREWNYQAAVEAFNAYIAGNNSSEYSLLVGRVNLVHALNSQGENEEARKEVLKIIEVAQSQGHTRLLLNCKQLLCDIYYGLKSWKELREIVSELTKLIDMLSIEEKLNLERWCIIVDYTTHRIDNDGLKFKLLGLYLKCSEAGFYELARSCHYYMSKYLKTEELVLYNYFGSPFEVYRKLLLDNHKKVIEKYDSLIVGNEKNVLDLSSMKFNQKTILKPHSALAKVLRIVASDLYAPISRYHIFEEIYPDEVFNPIHSDNKTRSLLVRLNQTFEEESISLKVVSRKSYVSLAWNKSEVGIRCYKKYSAPLLQLVRNEMNELPAGIHFQIKDLESLKEVDRKKIKVIMDHFIAEDVLEKKGQGPNTRYHLKKTA